MSDDRRLLTAHTALVNIPPYLNISQYPNGDVEFTVRGSAVAHESKKYQVSGPTASIRLTPDEFRTVYFEVTKNFRS